MEMLVAAARRAGQPVGGCVVANDVSFKRAEVLVTQTQKVSELLANLIIVNHDARNFPRLESEGGTHLGYDRILCDVMCSGLSVGVTEVPMEAVRVMLSVPGSSRHCTCGSESMS